MNNFYKGIPVHSSSINMDLTNNFMNKKRKKSFTFRLLYNYLPIIIDLLS